MLAREGHDLLNLSIRSDLGILYTTSDGIRVNAEIVFKNKKIRKLYYCQKKQERAWSLGTIKMWKNNQNRIFGDKKTPPRGGEIKSEGSSV